MVAQNNPPCHNPGSVPVAVVMAGIRSLLVGFGGRYEPTPRFRHTSSRTRSKVLVHGGVTKDFSEETKRRLPLEVEVFDPYAEVWQKKKVNGEAPSPGVYTVASASVDDDLFTFGGYDGSTWYNSLHLLKDVSQWFTLCPQTKEAGSPMPKRGAQMVAFGDNLAVFGGHGIPHGPIQPGLSFIRDTRYSDGRGWTNEFHTYNRIDGMCTHTCRCMKMKWMSSFTTLYVVHIHVFCILTSDKNNSWLVTRKCLSRHYWYY